MEAMCRRPVFGVPYFEFAKVRVNGERIKANGERFCYQHFVDILEIKMEAKD